MTRQEFLDTVQDIDDLYNFCCDNGFDGYFDDIYSSDNIEELICERVNDITRHNSWTDARDFLNDIPDGYDWYRVSSYDNEISGMSDDDFADLYRDVLDYLDDIDWFDDEEELELVDDDDEDPIDIDPCVPDEKSQAVSFEDFLEANTVVTTLEFSKAKEAGAWT